MHFEIIFLITYLKDINDEYEKRYINKKILPMFLNNSYLFPVISSSSLNTRSLFFLPPLGFGMGYIFPLLLNL